MYIFLLNFRNFTNLKNLYNRELFIPLYNLMDYLHLLTIAFSVLTCSHDNLGLLYCQKNIINYYLLSCSFYGIFYCSNYQMCSNYVGKLSVCFL